MKETKFSFQMESANILGVLERLVIIVPGRDHDAAVSCPFLLELTEGPAPYVLAETLAIPHPVPGPWHSSIKLLG